MSLQFRSKLATQTSQETEDIELEGGVARGLDDGPAIGCDDPAVGSASATATRSRPSLSPDVMPMLPVRPKARHTPCNFRWPDDRRLWRRRRRLLNDPHTPCDDCRMTAHTTRRQLAAHTMADNS